MRHAHRVLLGIGLVHFVHVHECLAREALCWQTTRILLAVLIVLEVVEGDACHPELCLHHEVVHIIHPRLDSARPYLSAPLCAILPL
eukprot:7582880-Heterocapsa_arctica.AAC.1